MKKRIENVYTVGNYEIRFMERNNHLPHEPSISINKISRSDHLTPFSEREWPEPIYLPLAHLLDLRDVITEIIDDNELYAIGPERCDPIRPTKPS